MAFLELVWDVFYEDCLILFPILFLTFFFIEYLEHRAGEKFLRRVEKAEKTGPLWGALIGCVPQCGFSVSCAHLFNGGIVTAGTLIAVFLSTSDEALPVLLSHRSALPVIWKLLLFLYVVTVTLGLVFLPQLMKMLGADPADSVTRTYIRTQLIFVPIMFSQGPFYFFVNADNGPKTASIAMSLSGITDAVFSYIFVIRMKLGVAGSVYSTVVGALLMVAITGSHIARKKGALRFCRERMDWAAVRQAAHTGFATSLQYVFQFITMIAVNRLLVRLGGPVAVAAFDVVYNISLLCNSVSEGAVFAMEPMISSYRSERNLDNMRITLHMGFRASMMLAFLFGCLLSVYSPQFSMFFGMKSGIELEYTAEGIHLFALCVLPATANILFSGYYQAALQEWLAYLITFLRSFLFYLTALFLCTRNGMQDFWFIFVVVEMLTIIFWVPVASLRGGILQLKGIRVENAKTVVIDSGRQDIHEIVEQFQEFSEAHGADARQSMYIALTIEEICCALIDRFRDKMGRIYIQVTAVVEDGDVTRRGGR